VRFVDTNVLLYAVSTAPEEAAKAATARLLLEADDLALSVQVLQEFYVEASAAAGEAPSATTRQARWWRPSFDSASRRTPSP
jgi:predicted nucleic acid-binding protein